VSGMFEELVFLVWAIDVAWTLLAVGCWLLAVGCWLLAVGCWLLAVGCWLLAGGDRITNCCQQCLMEQVV
jgi:hypothetical protein